MAGAVGEPGARKTTLFWLIVLRVCFLLYPSGFTYQSVSDKKGEQGSSYEGLRPGVMTHKQPRAMGRV